MTRLYSHPLQISRIFQVEFHPIYIFIKNLHDPLKILRGPIRTPVLGDIIPAYNIKFLQMPKNNILNILNKNVHYSIILDETDDVVILLQILYFIRIINHDNNIYDKFF